MIKITWNCVRESDNVAGILIWGLEVDYDKEVEVESNNMKFEMKRGGMWEKGRK